MSIIIDLSSRKVDEDSTVWLLASIKHSNIHTLRCCRDIHGSKRLVRLWKGSGLPATRAAAAGQGDLPELTVAVANAMEMARCVDS